MRASWNRTCCFWTVSGLVLLVSGCAGKLPVEIQDINRALGEAKDACASVYAADQLSALQSDVDGMNRLADDKKYRKARKEAEGLTSRIATLKTTTQSARSAAKNDADAAIAKAGSALDSARAAEAQTYAAGDFGSASGKLDQARAAAQDPCKYTNAAKLANEAASLADKARTSAIAEKKRREEEERRLAEERRRREEEEARRRAEEEARRRQRPPSYVVEKGDYLWKISGMQQVYEAPKFWPLLFDANRGMIQNPDLIYPGQKLTIPREMSGAEMMDKLRRMWSKAARGEL